MSSSEEIPITDLKMYKGMAIPPYLTKWLEYGQEAVKNSPTVLNEFAKYMIGLVSAVITIYTGGLTLLGISVNTLFYPYTIILIAPYIPWLVCIYRSVEVLNPKLLKYSSDDIDDIKDKFDKNSKYKYKKVRESTLWFLAGISIAGICLIVLPLVSHYSNQHSVQFLVSDNNTPIFNNMSLKVNTDTHKTDTVLLIDESGDSYKVKLSDGSMVKFSKSLTTSIFYLG
jgi:hypothetical protein